MAVCVCVFITDQITTSQLKFVIYPALRKCPLKRGSSALQTLIWQTNSQQKSVGQNK